MYYRTLLPVGSLRQISANFLTNRDAATDFRCRSCHGTLKESLNVDQNWFSNLKVDFAVTLV